MAVGLWSACETTSPSVAGVNRCTNINFRCNANFPGSISFCELVCVCVCVCVCVWASADIDLFCCRGFGFARAATSALGTLVSFNDCGEFWLIRLIMLAQLSLSFISTFGFVALLGTRNQQWGLRSAASWLLCGVLGLVSMALYVSWSEDFADSVPTTRWDYQYSFVLLTLGWLLQIMPGAALIFVTFAHRIMCCCPEVFARSGFSGFG